MEVFIQDAVRTPRGKARPDGGLAAQTPHGLVAELVQAIRSRNDVDLDKVEQMTLGCVGQVNSQGGHIAMVAKIASDLPDRMAVHSINNFCASGLSAVGQAYAAIGSGQAALALAGGVEMLSQVPFMEDHATYYTDTSFPPSTRYIPVALAADRLAAQLDISRGEMDELALLSQTRALAAEENAMLSRSRIPVAGLEREENIRVSSAEKMALLPPAFAGLADQYREALGNRPFRHQMTVAHAPPMADGAALALLGTAETMSSPRARIVAFAESGGDLEQSLLAGFRAMDIALDRAGLALEDMDRIEFMEAFAVTIAQFVRDRQPDMTKVNVGGGHIAKGHPMGATGAILLSTLLDALDESGGRYGLVVTTGAQGVGAAMIVERLA